MVNQTTTSYKTINTYFPPIWETNYKDDEPPPRVQYENDSIDNESNDEDNLPWQEWNRHRQMNCALRQQMYALQQQGNGTALTNMNASNQQIANERAKR